jgi:glycosyltransferase involved in cell wall biosynthesis
MNINNPKVSFVLSVYNDEKHISRAIESMLEQKNVDFEIILVNDGSVDDTLNIIKKYATLNNCIKIINNNINIGLTKCLNMAILESRGEYIARLDSDDFSLNDRIFQQILAIKSDPLIGVVATPAIIFMNNGNHQLTEHLDEKQLKRKIKYVNCVQHSSVLIRRDMLEKIGLYDEKLSTTQDYDLWLRTLYAGYKICMMEKPLVARTISHKSISRRKLFRQSVNSYKIRKRYSTVSFFMNILLFLHQFLFGSFSNFISLVKK